MVTRGTASGTTDGVARRHERGAEALWYALVALVTVVAEVVVLRIWRANLTIPFQNTADAAGSVAGVKDMIETGWYWVNPHLGAPGVTNLLDYPGAETLHLLVQKLLGVTGSAGMTVNLYYLLTFPLCALTAAWAMRRLGIGRPAAMAGSILFAFLPYHLLNGVEHLYLGAYFMVPPLALLAIELCGSKPPLRFEGESGTTLWTRFKRSEVWLPLLICLLAGSAGIYYAYFGAFFLAMAGVWAWWRHRDAGRLLIAGVLIAALAFSVALNLAPFVWYRHSVGANPYAAQRSAVEAEVYGLRITQLVLPVRDHRVAPLADIRARYTRNLVAIFGQSMENNEADRVALGIVGSLGLLACFWWLFFGFRNRPGEREVSLGANARFAGAAVLIATIGGFGALAALRFAQIRAYNRIVAYLGFFVFLAVAYLIDRAAERFGRRALAAGWLIAALVLCVGLYDQTTPAMVPDYAGNAAVWDSNGSFISSIESGLKPGAMVFQLPYVPYPENPPVFAMADYDHLKPYMQSSKIHWSYGAVRGRADAAWNERVAAMPPEQMVQTLKDRGFVGIWIDRAGYADQAAELMTELSTVLGQRPRVSSDGRYAYFSLTD